MSRPAPRCAAPARAPGDGLWVSGTIGDGALGLLAARGEIADPGGTLADRYRLPRPRLALGQAVAGIAMPAWMSPTAWCRTPAISAGAGGVGVRHRGGAGAALAGGARRPGGWRCA